MQIIGNVFIELDTIESSNTYAQEQVKNATATHGTAFFAHYQTGGKGQRGKKWVAARGENIALSVVMDMRFLDPQKTFLLAASVALACRAFVQEMTNQPITIKWANDIYWRNKKVGGILIENLFTGNQWNWAIVGIGINVNQTTFPPELNNPSSIKQIATGEHDVLLCCKKLCEHLEMAYQNLLHEKTTNIIEDYTKHLYKLNSSLQFRSRKNGSVHTATILGINERGQLLIAGAAQSILDFSEVDFLI